MAYVETDPSGSPGQTGEESMTAEWYSARDGEQLGPVGFDELKRRASAGLLRAEDLVWCEGQPEWEPASRISGLFPRIATEWYYSRGDDRLGPVSDDALKRLAEVGQLRPSDLVWSEGDPDWKPAAEVPGLFDDLPTGEDAPQPEGGSRRVQGYAATDEAEAILGRTTQAATEGGVGGVPSGEAGTTARNAPGPTNLARLPGRLVRLLALLLQAPLAALAIRAGFGSDWPASPEGSGGPASVLFWLGLAALWFGLSDAMIGDVLDASRPRNWPGDVVPRLRRLGAMGVLGAGQCAVAWVIVAGFTGLSGAGLASLALLILASAVGLALGCLVIATAPRPPVRWAALVLAMVSLWLFGGGPQSLPREAPWARAISNAVPSRWAFEGLILLRLDGPASPEAAVPPNRHGRWGMANAYFPADSERMGARADVMALVSMLLGLSAAAAFLTWVSEERRGTPPIP
jgi:GYF domain 2